MFFSIFYCEFRKLYIFLNNTFWEMYEILNIVGFRDRTSISPYKRSNH